MNDIPMLRIELEGVRSQIVTMLSDHDSNVQKMIAETIEKTITMDWVQEQISKTVNELLEQSIKKVASNWDLQCAISEMVSTQISMLVSASTSIEKPPQ